MNKFLGTDYSSPIDIGLNQITKNWAGFLKLHLKHPLKDGNTIERKACIRDGNLKGENGSSVKLKRALSWSQRHKTFDSTSNVTYYAITTHITIATH